MRLIDVDQLIKELKKDIMGGLNYERIIKEQPTIEAEPVRHGYWIERYGVHEGKYYKCSACNYNCSHTKENYCSYCGAKMDAERRQDAEKL